MEIQFKLQQDLKQDPLTVCLKKLKMYLLVIIVKAALLVEPRQGWQPGQAGHAGCRPGRAEQGQQDR